MVERSAIVNALDRFIERFKINGETDNGHKLATRNNAVVTGSPAENQGFGHCGHFGHRKSDYCENDHDDPPAQHEAGVTAAQEVSFRDGQNGHNGQSQVNRGFGCGHSGNLNGDTGHSQLDHPSKVSRNPATDWERSGILSVDVAGWEAEYWNDIYHERAAMREYDGRYTRDEAEVLAWGEIENRWHLKYGERVPRDLCAGCRRPIGGTDVLDLIDGNRVHITASQDCLMRHGNRWRRNATRALLALGLRPPKSAW
jgi:hypothetical protein